MVNQYLISDPDDFSVKYPIGSLVHRVRTRQQRLAEVCEVCDGDGYVEVPKAEDRALCPTCQGQGKVWTDGDELVATIEPVTVTLARVEITEAPSSTGWLKRVTYMGPETGVPSGTVHDEADLFPTHDEALEAAAKRAHSVGLTLREAEAS